MNFISRHLRSRHPFSYSQITDYLYISSWPRPENAGEIAGLGVRLVLSMHWTRPSEVFDRPPMQLLLLPTFDSPLFPIPIKTLNKGVQAALPVIHDGGVVLTHCVAGVHRSVAQAACVLIGMGCSADDAMQLIKEKRAVADPNARHIRSRIRKFETYWQSQS